VGQEIKIDDIISFNCTIKLSYKNCDVTVKRYGNIADLTIAVISGKGYIVERNNTFICSPGYNHLLNYLNENIGHIENIYNEVMEKSVRNDDIIRDFEVV